MFYFCLFVCLVDLLVGWLVFKNFHTKKGESKFFCERVAIRGLCPLFGAMWSKLVLDSCDFALRVVARNKQVLHFQNDARNETVLCPGGLITPREAR